MPARGSWTPSVCFFAIAVAYTVGWTAVSSELTYFTSMHGPEILLLLNVAYFVPSVPIMAMQTLCDAAFDRTFGAATAMALRFVLGKRRPWAFGRMYGTAMLDKLALGLGGAALVCATFPFHAQKAGVLLLAVGLLGVFCGVAFGSSYQLVSRFGSHESVALTTGFVGSGPVVLLLEAALRIGAQPQKWQRVALFESVTVIIVAGLGAGLYLLSRSWRDLGPYDRLEHESPRYRSSAAVDQDSSAGGGRTSVRRQTVGRQSSFGTALFADQSQHQHEQALQSVLVHGEAGAEDDLSAPLIGADIGAPLETVVSGVVPDGLLAPPRRPSSNGSGSIRMLHIWPAAVALALSSFTSVLLFPFFTYVPMTRVFGIMQPSALFAARVVADILGRLAPKGKWVQTPVGLLAWSTIRVLVTPLFFLYISGRLPWAKAELAVAYVAAFWFTSGLCNTCAFILAPQLVPPALAARAGGAMALVFQTSSLLALVTAWLIQMRMRRGSVGGLGLDMKLIE